MIRYPFLSSLCSRYRIPGLGQWARKMAALLYIRLASLPRTSKRAALGYLPCSIRRVMKPSLPHRNMAPYYYTQFTFTRGLYAGLTEYSP
jgi:hypothetical protein